MGTQLRRRFESDWVPVKRGMYATKPALEAYKQIQMRLTRSRAYIEKLRSQARCKLQKGVQIED